MFILQLKQVFPLPPPFSYPISLDTIQTTPNDPLEVLVEPITRSRAKKIKDVFIGLIQSI